MQLRTEKGTAKNLDWFCAATPCEYFGLWTIFEFTQKKAAVKLPIFAPRRDLNMSEWPVVNSLYHLKVDYFSSNSWVYWWEASSCQTTPSHHAWYLVMLESWNVSLFVMKWRGHVLCICRNGPRLSALPFAWSQALANCMMIDRMITVLQYSQIVPPDQSNTLWMWNYRRLKFRLKTQ